MQTTGKQCHQSANVTCYNYREVVCKWSHQGNSFNRDASGNHPPAHHCQSGAEGVAEYPAHTHPVHVLPGGEDHRGQLGPVPPLREGRHREGLDEDLARHGECCFFRLVGPSLQVAAALLLLPLPQLLIDLLQLLLAFRGGHVVTLVNHFDPEHGKQQGRDVVSHGWKNC